MVDRETRQPYAGAPEVTGTTATIAGSGEAAPLMHVGEAAHPGEDAIEREGPAHGGEQGRLTLWLFQPDAAPQSVDLAALPALVADDDNFVWIDLSRYGRDQFCRVAELLGLHRSGVYTALSSWQRPHLDVFGDHFLVSATVARLDPRAYRVQAGQLDLFVGNNYLFSAHHQPLPFAERASSRARQSPDLVKLDSAYMLYIVLDELLAYHERLDEGMQGQIELLEERALTDTTDRFLQDLIHFKRYAFALSQLVEQHRDVFDAFLRPDFRFVAGQEVEVYFRDLQGRLAHLGDTLAMARDAVNGAFDIYVSHMAHRTNSVMKVLTLVSTVLLPLTVILGFFSTSIQGIPILSQPIDFVVMLAIMACVSGTILLIFRRNHWI